MNLSGSKIIAVLCITTAISSVIEVLTEVQQQQNFTNNNYNRNNSNNSNYNNKSSPYELKVLNEFLDYNQLHRAIIIYTSSTSTATRRASKILHDNRTSIADKFVQFHIIRKLSENYHIQFVNTLSPNCSEYLFSSFIHGTGVFMKYNANDKGKNLILNLASMGGLYNKSLKWLVLMEGVKEPLIAIEKGFGHLNILIDADVTVAVYREEHILDLYDVFKICHECDLPLEIEYKGNWTFTRGFTILKKFKYGIAVRRNNFKMFPLKATTTVVAKSPVLNMSDFEYLSNDKVFLDEDTMQRKTYHLVKLMEDLFNFTFDIEFAENWGTKVNGVWTGTLGLLESNRAEMTLAPIRYLLERTSACTYSRNLHIEKIYFLFRHPKHTSIRNIFFEPLSDIVWWCVLALIFVTILLLAIHVQTEYKLFTMLQTQQQANGGGSANSIKLPVKKHFDFIVLCIMEAILMQGPVPELFHHNSTRLLIVSISIFSVLLMQFYGAFIVGSLLSEAPRTITNLQALYDSNLEMGIENISYHYEVFIKNTNLLAQKLYKNRICNKHTHHANAFTLEEGVEKIGEGNFAFHISVDRAYRVLKSLLTESEFCELQEINFHPPDTFSSGLCMRRSTPYYEHITLALAMLQEAALFAYNNKKWEVDKIDCMAVKTKEVEVDLQHFAPALVFLAFAMLISLLALVIEIIYYKISIRLNLKRVNK